MSGTKGIPVPEGIAQDAQGRVLVSDQGAFGGPGAVFRVDPAGGATSTVSK